MLPDREPVCLCAVQVREDARVMKIMSRNGLARVELQEAEVRTTHVLVAANTRNWPSVRKGGFMMPIMRRTPAVGTGFKGQASFPCI